MTSYWLRSRHMQVHVYDDAEELAQAAAAKIAGWFANAAHRTIGLAGGSTPRRTYELLRHADLPWNRIHAWLTDERHVPIEHPDSNGGMALESLLLHVPARFHPVEYHQDAESAAAAYERTLRSMWDSTETGGDRDSGLVILGIGDDGHTASLFPGTPALEEDERDYVSNWVEAKGTWRLTATMPLLARAGQTMFLVTGRPKAGVVADILERGSDHPAAVVSRASVNPVWLLDEAAASEFRS